MPLVLVTDGRANDYIQLPRDQVIEPAMNAQVFAVELGRVIAAAAQLVQTENGASAVGLLEQASFRIQSFREEWHRIAGLAEAAPSCYDGILAFADPNRSGDDSGAVSQRGVSPQVLSQAAAVRELVPA